MKNDYELRINHYAIFINNPDGTKTETLIDIDDLEKVLSISGAWRATRVNLTAPYYVYGTIKMIHANGEPEKRQVALARYLLDFPKGLVVDHIDENTLDNRKSNLQAITNGENVRKQMWRKKPKRQKDRIFAKPIRASARESDIRIMRLEASKLGMSLENWASMVLAEKIGVKPFFKEYIEDSAV